MRLFPIILTLLVCACSKGKDVRSSRNLNKYETTKNYFTSSTSLTVEVAYESGQEPYAEGTTLTISDSTFPIWQVLDENLNALFLGRTPYPLIKVPKRIEDMRELPVQGRTKWSPEDLMKLASKYRTGKSSTKDTYFWVVFVSGIFTDGETDFPSTVGVSLGGTTVVAIFKDVVRATDGGAGLVPRYVEQATLVHEIGHALGLVDNGLPMKDVHKDSNGHGAHCNNPDCVMYWLNEGRSDLVQFAIRMSTSGSVIMYDDKCLKDAREY